MARSRLCVLMLMLSALAAACGLATLSATPVPPPTVAPTAVPPILELSGSSGTRSLSMGEIKQLPAVEGYGGLKNTAGRITPPARFKGVALATLCDLVGGLTSEDGVALVAKDGFAATFSYEQAALGKLITYDPTTGITIPYSAPLTAVLAYEEEGQAISPEKKGPLVGVVLSSAKDQVTDGHWWVKWVARVEFKQAAREWSLDLSGQLAETVVRGTYESCSAPGCHGQTWKDDSGRLWSGVPLWILVGAVDDAVKHGLRAFSDRLANQGYSVQVVAGDGYSTTLHSAAIKFNNKLLLANQVDGDVVDDTKFPLQLVGPGLQQGQMVGKVAQVIVHAPGSGPPAPTAAPAPTNTPAVAAPPAPVRLTIAGRVETELSLYLEAQSFLQAVSVTAEHPQKGPQAYRGWRLNDLLAMAGASPDAQALVLVSADGYRAEVAWSEVVQCVACLVASTDEGLQAVMPGMFGNRWVRGLVRIEVK